MAERCRVATLADLWDGEMRGCRVGGTPVVLVRVGDTVHAWRDRCPHLGVRLSEGELEDGILTCPAHHFQYDACTGAGVNPRNVQLHPYPVTVVDGEIEVEVDE